MIFSVMGDQHEVPFLFWVVGRESSDIYYTSILHVGHSFVQVSPMKTGKQFDIIYWQLLYSDTSSKHVKTNRLQFVVYFMAE